MFANLGLTLSVQQGFYGLGILPTGVISFLLFAFQGLGLERLSGF